MSTGWERSAVNEGGGMGTNTEMTNEMSLMVRFRRPLSMLVHAGLFLIAHAGAFALRFEFSIPDDYVPVGWLWLGVSLGMRLVAFAWFGMFSGMWRYTGTRDLEALAKSAVFSTLAFAGFLVVGGYRNYPRSILVIDLLVTMSLVGGLRFGVRSLWQIAVNSQQRRGGARSRRVLVVGAGNAGEAIVREMQRTTWGMRYEAVGFADDAAGKQGARIHGVPVLGALADVPHLVRVHRVDEVVVAIPSATGRAMRQIVDVVKAASVPIRTIPGVDQLIDGRVTVNQMRSVSVEDLLGRDPVTLDLEALEKLLEGRVVMVTGAGGSIGSELCRQVVRFRPSKLVLLERSENALFEIHRELSANRRCPLVPALADLCDEARVRRLFSEHRPAVVLHAAAHKHVPMMEENPGEAIKNNIGGTRALADIAHEFKTDRFVMISTDKAVNPTSVMGATKRVAELYVQALSQKSATRFVAVRFGNVLGSAGSVIPIFKEQIAAGGPVTVTHPEMKRYFMTIPEASQLVLQAGAMGHGGEIFVLDMGEPVRIVDLARDLISLSGLVPDKDIEIRFTGLRPGEKLFEELSTEQEQAEKTRHPKIFIGKLPSLFSLDQVSLGIDDLIWRSDRAQGMHELIERLRKLVPELRRKDYAGEAEVIPIRGQAS
jgi:FlaA1/EpsC-like NDP-sugar epimerase